MKKEPGTPHRRMTGVSLGAETTSDAEAALREIAESADIAELRLDFMAEFDLPRLIRNRPCPLIVTNRPEREGGRFRGDETERVGPLLEAIDLGVEYVDVEHDATHLIPDRKETQLVVSYHDFEGMPDDLRPIYNDLASKGADVVKIVGMAQSILDNLPVLDVLAQASLPTIAIAMGEAGLTSRVLALRYDSCFLSYATMAGEQMVAPGQLPIETMRDIYQAERIGARTETYGVLSAERVPNERLSSLNRAAREAGVDGVWVPFVASSANGDSPADVLTAFRRLGVAGYIVAESAQEAMSDAVDSIASPGPDGRINVIRLVDGRLVGDWKAEPAAAFSLITGRRMPIQV